ncbi:MAG: hypothetical protein WBK67_01940 [Minisyncoccales bacterium]
MAETLTTEKRLDLERKFLADLCAAPVVDVISACEADGSGISVEQIGFRLPEGSTLYLCPETPQYLTISRPDDEAPELFEPVEHYGRRS